MVFFRRKIMKRKMLSFLYIATFFICVSATYANGAEKKTSKSEREGIAYFEATKSCVLAGKYKNGDPEWEKDHDEWIENGNEPWPNENDVDGDGYRDGLRAVEDQDWILGDQLARRHRKDHPRFQERPKPNQNFNKKVKKGYV